MDYIDQLEELYNEILFNLDRSTEKQAALNGIEAVINYLKGE